MPMPRVAVLDDYQQVALASADWSAITTEGCAVFYRETVEDIAAWLDGTPARVLLAPCMSSGAAHVLWDRARPLGQIAAANLAPAGPGAVAARPAVGRGAGAGHHDRVNWLGGR